MRHRVWADRGLWGQTIINNVFLIFRHVVAKLGLKMTDDQIKDMIKIADKDGDGDVNYLEFVRLMKK